MSDKEKSKPWAALVDLAGHAWDKNEGEMLSYINNALSVITEDELDREDIIRTAWQMGFACAFIEGAEPQPVFDVSELEHSADEVECARDADPDVLRRAIRHIRILDPCYAMAQKLNETLRQENGRLSARIEEMTKKP